MQRLHSTEIRVRYRARRVSTEVMGTSYYVRFSTGGVNTARRRGEYDETYREY